MIISIAKLEISYVIENIKAFSLATWITYLHPCYMTGADDTMGPSIKIHSHTHTHIETHISKCICIFLYACMCPCLFQYSYICYLVYRSATSIMASSPSLFYISFVVVIFFIFNTKRKHPTIIGNKFTWYANLL